MLHTALSVVCYARREQRVLSGAADDGRGGGRGAASARARALACMVVVVAVVVMRGIRLSARLPTSGLIVCRVHALEHRARLFCVCWQARPEGGRGSGRQ